jgi:hypothetical protein
VSGILGVYVMPLGGSEVRAAEEALSCGGFDNLVWAEDVDVGMDEATRPRRSERRLGDSAY